MTMTVSHRDQTVPVSFFLVLAIVLLVQASPCFADDDPLVAGFQNPPVSARPQTWWDWMNGNITKEGITADLEAMHRVGISEANIITIGIDGWCPPGPVPMIDPKASPQLNPQFVDMVQFAAQEADRLGMTLCMNNCSGWSSSGGPWVTPDHGAQAVTTSETGVQGPASATLKLKEPPAFHAWSYPFYGPPQSQTFYRDIAVLAFRTSEGRQVSDIHATYKATDANIGKDVTDIVSKMLQGGSLTMTVDNDTLGGDAAPGHVKELDMTYTQEGKQATVTLKEGAMLNLSGQMMIQDIDSKARVNGNVNLDPLKVIKDKQIAADPDRVVHRDSIVDLTSSMTSDGTLTWDVPEGHWTILRVGYAPTGGTNKAGPPEGIGLECDKYSPDGMDACWNGMMQPILDRLGPLAGRVLDDCLIDSYEARDQNWTRLMIDDFKQLRGYDPTPFLPVMTGRVVDSPEVSERFLWDLRRTVSDLFAKNYYGRFTELCHEHGLKSLVETYEGPYESIQCGADNDVPMGEFWAGWPSQFSTASGLEGSVKMASSVGHIYGQKIVGAESYTSGDEHGKWMDDPYSLKALGDIAFCAGINRFVFHRYAHQPWLDKYPGMVMGVCGINLDRTNTWFEMAKPWMDYLARSQFLLQQGKSVSDAAYFCGQSAPVVVRSGTPPLPQGYDYDDINADVLLTRAKVVNHRLVLNSGANYAVLVLPEADPEITPELLGKIREFVHDGLIVVGPRPDHSPSLQDYPNCDQKVQKLAAELWGDCDGKKVTEHALGDGKVVFGEPLDKIFSGIHLLPDFQAGGPGEMHYIHRTLDNADIYFVAYNGGNATHKDCSFRISGKIPELWHPDTGAMEPAPAYQVKDGRTIVPLDFDPSGSVFVVFRQADATAGDHAVAATRQLTNGPAIPVEGSWVLNFPPNWGAPPSVTLDRLISWPDDTDPGIKYFSGTATYVKDIEIPADLLAKGNLLTLDLGVVKNLARVKLNGTDLGILWKPPFRVDIASAAKPGTNHLEISVVNLWPNRLIGDEQLPPDVEWNADGGMAKWPQWLLDGKPSPNGRLTFTNWHHITKDMPLLPSGLLGPVTLQPAKWGPALYR
jgi:hypothetical protein